MTLYRLAANCNYGELDGEMIRDRLVVGIRDSALSERLQLNATLKLEKAEKTIRQKQSVHEQQNILSGAEGPSVDGIRTSHDREKHRERREQRRPNNGGRPKQRPAPKQCTRCERDPHPRNKCPAKDATCHKCRKKGHYGAQRVGSGRSVSIKETRHLQILCGPSRKPLQVVGQCQMTLASKGRSSSQEVFVVKQLRSNLLGLPAIKALRLATRLDETTTEFTPPLSATYILDRFKKIFQGLGNLGEEYEVNLKPGTTPFAFFTPRRVALPLRERVAEELKRMETMGVISRVDVPTTWCAGMVVAPKKSGLIRIGVDLKPLNQSVLREVHPLPKVDDTLAQLTGTKVFSKLDTNSGFWQIPLSPASRLLTTFITPFGRFCFNKLPFGISSAPEHFQKRMSRILTGLDGVVCQMDDVMVFGKNKAQHDCWPFSSVSRSLEPHSMPESVSSTKHPSSFWVMSLTRRAYRPTQIKQRPSER